MGRSMGALAALSLYLVSVGAVAEPRPPIAATASKAVPADRAARLHAPEIFGLPTLPNGHSYVREGRAILQIVDQTGEVIRRIGAISGLEE